MREETVILDLSDFQFPTKEEIRASVRPRSEIIKPVVEYSLDGEVLNTYDSCRKASEALGIPQGTIRNCCIGKNNKYCKILDRIFLFRGDDISKRLELLDKREEVEWKTGLARSIDEYNLKGRLLTVYSSQKIAASVNKITIQAIRACCNGNKKHLYIGNRIYLHHGDNIKERLPLVKEKLFLESQRRKKCTPVDEYTLDGQFVKGYISASEASRATGCTISNILDCCRSLGHGTKADYLQTKGRIFLFAGNSISERLELIESKKKAK